MKILIVAATDFELEKDQFSAHEILITGVGILETTLELTKKLALDSRKGSILYHFIAF